MTLDQLTHSTLSFAIQPRVDPTPAEVRKRLLEDPGFGRVFTDHMATIRWTAQGGWQEPQIRGRAPFQLDPAAAVLHYAQEIFEGLKAYRTPSDELVLFRPFENAKRFIRSAERMSMPALPEETFVAAIEALLQLDGDWTPTGEGSLYLRPFMFATEAFLGVRPAAEYMFCVIASPAGAYFKGGVKPVKVWASEQLTRAAPGGTGAAKCGGNYASSLLAQAEASEHGCDQVVFLDAVEHRWIEELGGMNIFFVFEDRLVTPPLGGSILPGITRATLMQLAEDAGLVVEERPYAFDSWREDAAAGRLREAFACGTAAVVAAIGEVRSARGDFKINGGDEGPVTRSLRERLVAIQRGQAPDPYGWVHRVSPGVR